MESWREQNRDRKYPFMDTSSLSNGTDAIPEYVIVDARLYPAGHEGRLFVSKVSVKANRTFIIEISDGTNGVVGSGTGNSDSKVLKLEDSYGRPAGVLVAGPLNFAYFANWSTGDHVFNEDQTSFVPRVQLPMPKLQVTGITLDDESFFTGDVWLVGENGVRLRTDGSSIRIDVIGDPLKLFRTCRDIGDEADNAITDLFRAKALRTINGIAPDEFGNFQIIISAQANDLQLLRITPMVAGLTISGAVTTKRGL
jgi:hypothetical protein